MTIGGRGLAGGAVPYLESLRVPPAMRSPVGNWVHSRARRNSWALIEIGGISGATQTSSVAPEA